MQEEWRDVLEKRLDDPGGLTAGEVGALAILSVLMLNDIAEALEKRAGQSSHHTALVEALAEKVAEFDRRMKRVERDHAVRMTNIEGVLNGLSGGVHMQSTEVKAVAAEVENLRVRCNVVESTTALHRGWLEQVARFLRRHSGALTEELMDPEGEATRLLEQISGTDPREEPNGAG